MILGITGTRNPISEEQRAWLGLAIAEAERVHHGACVNADEDSHDLALECRWALGRHIVNQHDDEVRWRVGETPPPLED